MEIEQALQTGAMALFGEKYGERVRVVSVPGFSRELCGGTHVSRTGDIGLCKITSESSISAGVRRIEAVTGIGALDYVQSISTEQHRLRAIVQSTGSISETFQRILGENRGLKRDIEEFKTKFAQSQLGGLEQSARSVKGVKVISAQVNGLDRTQLRNLADALRNKWKSGIVVLATTEDSKVAIISAVTKDLTSKVHAGKLVGSIAQAVGGKGGGRPDMAEAGGTNSAALPSALETVYSTVESML
jgi:alanyl-tRNA synthetase